ncbi:MAG: tRNA (N6-isopentenyl adenosine(37)-C2)-methylthiotransferase MiaB [Saprospiraceae bacterium]|nr:tRNA (N6-isopentenyl adenosine(37)-C2)-methylthiotransferase MiaB [Saprospiraceae bacterium]
MNFSDSEIVVSILKENSYNITENIKEADIVFVNTCSIRDHAEQRVLNRLEQIKNLKKHKSWLKVGVLGCMAERLKEKLLELDKSVDLIVGPDAYRDLPKLLNEIDESGQKACNIILSEEETYSDISPVRYNSNGVSAFISIMRGCENFCTYCVVPYTRGKERSRSPETIINEAKDLFKNAYKEITLLGQNVNSYKWTTEDGEIINFPSLLISIAKINPLLRVRFATSHPKDISDELIETIAKTKNICNSIHLPVQSGSTDILKKMNRKYTREWYLERIAKIKELIPDCGLSTDVITGFCGETQEDHQQTISLMKEVGFDYAFMFKYSERPDTAAEKRFDDDVTEEEKGKRLQQIIELQQKLSHKSNLKDIGKTFEVLAEGISKRSDEKLTGRSSQGKVVVFPKMNFKKGDYVMVKITDCTTATLRGEVVE